MNNPGTDQKAPLPLSLAKRPAAVMLYYARFNDWASTACPGGSEKERHATRCECLRCGISGGKISSWIR